MLIRPCLSVCRWCLSFSFSFPFSFLLGLCLSAVTYLLGVSGCEVLSDAHTSLELSFVKVPAAIQLIALSRWCWLVHRIVLHPCVGIRHTHCDSDDILSRYILTIRQRNIEIHSQLPI